MQDDKIQLFVTSLSKTQTRAEITSFFSEIAEEPTLISLRKSKGSKAPRTAIVTFQTDAGRQKAIKRCSEQIPKIKTRVVSTPEQRHFLNMESKKRKLLVAVISKKPLYSFFQKGTEMYRIFFEGMIKKGLHRLFSLFSSLQSISAVDQSGELKETPFAGLKTFMASYSSEKELDHAIAHFDRTLWLKKVLFVYKCSEIGNLPVHLRGVRNQRRGLDARSHGRISVIVRELEHFDDPDYVRFNRQSRKGYSRRRRIRFFS
jgi:hypothetical protein